MRYPRGTLVRLKSDGSRGIVLNQDPSALALEVKLEDEDAPVVVPTVAVEEIRPGEAIPPKTARLAQELGRAEAYEEEAKDREALKFAKEVQDGLREAAKKQKAEQMSPRQVFYGLLVWVFAAAILWGVGNAIGETIWYEFEEWLRPPPSPSNLGAVCDIYEKQGAEQ